MIINNFLNSYSWSFLILSVKNVKTNEYNLSCFNLDIHNSSEIK